MTHLRHHFKSQIWAQFLPGIRTTKQTRLGILNGKPPDEKELGTHNCHFQKSCKIANDKFTLPFGTTILEHKARTRAEHS